MFILYCVVYSFKYYTENVALILLIVLSKSYVTVLVKVQKLIKYYI